MSTRDRTEVKKKDVMISVDPKLHRELQEKAKKEGITVSELLLRPFKHDPDYRTTAIQVALHYTMDKLGITPEHYSSLYKNNPEFLIDIQKKVSRDIDEIARKLPEDTQKLLRLARAQKKVAEAEKKLAEG